MIAGVGFDPGLVVGGALAQDLLADRRNTDHVAEEAHHLRGPRQAAEVTVNHNAVKAMVDESHQVTEQQGEQFPWRSPQDPARGRKTITRDPASRSSRARIFVWAMRCATFSATRPITTAASSPSVSWSCSPPKPAMPGCSRHQRKQVGRDWGTRLAVGNVQASYVWLGREPDR